MLENILFDYSKQLPRRLVPQTNVKYGMIRLRYKNAVVLQVENLFIQFTCHVYAVFNSRVEITFKCN